jgi:hypothetical protein
MRALIAAAAAVSALAAPTAAAQPRAGDTIHVTVGSGHVNGRIYAEHAARVLVHRPGTPADRPPSQWTNVLTLGDSAGRPVQRWVSAGVQRAPSGDSLLWELRQNYDQETLAPYGYYRRASNGGEIRLTFEGNRVRGTRRVSATAPVEPIDITLPQAAFMANASDLVPLAVGLKEGLVMTAPMWQPPNGQFQIRVFTVLPRRSIDVEGTPVSAWPVEERVREDGTLVATWYLVEDSPYMVAGEVPLPNGGVQRMTEVAIPHPRK